MATIPYGGRSSLQYALGNRRNRLMADSASSMAPAQADGSYSIAAPPGQGVTPAAIQPSPISDIGSPIQSEIGRVRNEMPQAAQSYEADRMRQRDTLQQNMLGDIGASMSLAIPEVQNSLAAANLVESGAYPEALARRQAQLTAQMLPTLQNFDVGTFDKSSMLPLAGLDTEQALRRASIQRDYGVSDMISGQQNQQLLADKMAKQQELQALLGLVPALIGSGGIGGLFGGGAGGGATGGATGGLGGLGGILGGGGASQGGAGGGLLDKLKWLVGGNNALGGAIGGGLGEGLGQRLGIGSGWGGALGGALGGGGLGGALGGGLGGVFGDELGAGIGGGIGGAINKPVLDWFKNRNAIDLNDPNVFVGPQMPTGPSGQGYGDKALEGLMALFRKQQPGIPQVGGGAYASNPLPSIFDFGGY